MGLRLESGGKFGSLACDMDAFCLLVVSCLGVASQRQETGGGQLGGIKGIWEHCLRVKAVRLLVDGIGA